MSISRIFAAVAISFLLFGQRANADLVFFVSNYTTDEITFSITGTFDTTTAGTLPGYLAIKNDWSNNIGTHTEWFSATPTVTANTILIGGVAPLVTLPENSNLLASSDSLSFSSVTAVPYSAGTTVSGSVTLSLVGGFNPADLATLELVSGFDGGTQDWNRLEASASWSSVPEPTGLACIFGATFFLLFRRPQRRPIASTNEGNL